MASTGRHGWGGDPPADDVEARARIVAAATRCVDRYGAEKTGLSDVARELGVTRQTVYRYFDGTDDLLAAVARTAVAGFLDEVVEHVAGITEPAEVVVEVVAFTLEHLPEEHYLSLLLSSGRSGRFYAGVTSPAAIDAARSLLERTSVDWSSLGYDRAGMEEMVEFALRILQSLVLDRGARLQSPASLRAFLRRWVGLPIAEGAGAAGSDRSAP
ncbi:MAG: TetR/AcrR family transcriptional regulator [Acidimicrobiales bacterium]